MGEPLINLHGVRVVRLPGAGVTVRDTYRGPGFPTPGHRAVWPRIAQILLEARLADGIPPREAFVVDHHLADFLPLEGAVDGVTTVDELARLFQDVLKGLETFHASGLFHLFLRPELIWWRPLDRRVRFTGVVRAMGPDDCAVRPIDCIVDPWLAPEVTRPWSEEVPDHRTDYYALGRVFSWMIARAVERGVHLSSRKTETWERLLAALSEPRKADRPAGPDDIRRLLGGTPRPGGKPSPIDAAVVKLAASLDQAHEEAPWLLARLGSESAMRELIAAMGHRCDPERHVAVRLDASRLLDPADAAAATVYQITQLCRLLPPARRRALVQRLPSLGQELTWPQWYGSLDRLGEAGYRVLFIVENLQRITPPCADRLLLLKLQRPPTLILGCWVLDAPETRDWDTVSCSLGWSQGSVITVQVGSIPDPGPPPTPWYERGPTLSQTLKLKDLGDPDDRCRKFLEGQLVSLPLGELATELLEGLVLHTGRRPQGNDPILPFQWCGAAYAMGMALPKVRQIFHILRHRPGLDPRWKGPLAEAHSLFARPGDPVPPHSSGIQRAFFLDDWAGALDDGVWAGEVPVNFNGAHVAAARLLARRLCDPGPTPTANALAFDARARRLLETASPIHPATFEPLWELVIAAGHEVPEVSLVGVERVAQQARRTGRVPLLLMALAVEVDLTRRLGLQDWQARLDEERRTTAQRWMGFTRTPERTGDPATSPHLRGLDVGALLVALERLFEQERLYEEPGLRASDLARRLGISVRQLSELLSRYRGSNVRTLVAEYRVARARELLDQRPDLTVLDVAFKVGFQNSSTFYEAFKRITGTAPLAQARQS